MSNIMTRTFAGELVIRSDGRTITGMAVPYGVSAKIFGDGPPYDEVWAHGAFTKAIAENGDRVKLLINHNRMAMPIGRAVSLIETAAGLIGEFRVSDTPDGDTALTLVRDGALDSMSIGFKSIRASRRGNTVTRLEAGLREVSLCAFPSFADARIFSLRSMDPPPSIARRRLQIQQARLHLED